MRKKKLLELAATKLCGNPDEGNQKWRFLA